jgi:hypothetical protein
MIRPWTVVSVTVRAVVIVSMSGAETVAVARSAIRENGESAAV